MEGRSLIRSRTSSYIHLHEEDEFEVYGHTDFFLQQEILSPPTIVIGIPNGGAIFIEGKDDLQAAENLANLILERVKGCRDVQEKA